MALSDYWGVGRKPITNRPAPNGIRGIPKGPRRPPPKKLPGRLPPMPTMPTMPPKPPTPAPAAPPGMNFNNWYQTDPRYLLQHPQFAAQKAGLYAQYGWQPKTDAAGNVTGYNQSSAADNPFSIVTQLAQALAGNSQKIQDSANSRGLLFSGAQVQGQQNAATDYERSLSDAQRAFQNAIAGVNTDESQLLTELYPDYLAQAPPAGPAAAAAAGAAAKPGTAAAAAEAARKARIKKAQDHLRQDKINAAKKKPAPASKKKSTIGSGAASMRGIG